MSNADVQPRGVVSRKVIMHWGEMDSYSHLNNCVHFRYFESARIEHFRRLRDHLSESSFQSFMYAKGTGPILASTNCKYIRPVMFPDTLVVTSKLLALPEVGASRFTQDYTLWSFEQERVRECAERKTWVARERSERDEALRIPQHRF